MAVPNSKVVAEQLERNDVKQALETVNGLGDANGLRVGGDSFISFVTEDNRLGLAGGDLSECRLHLGVQRILGHDNDDGHILVNEGQRTVFQFTGKDTCDASILGLPTRREMTYPRSACS